MTEMDNLILMLNISGIPYEVTECWGTPQVWYPNKKDVICDVICHQFSYGGNQGLLEIMGLLTNEEVKWDDVVGYLTAKDVFKRIVAHYLESAK